MAHLAPAASRLPARGRVEAAVSRKRSPDKALPGWKLIHTGDLDRLVTRDLQYFSIFDEAYFKFFKSGNINTVVTFENLAVGNIVSMVDPDQGNMKIITKTGKEIILQKIYPRSRRWKEESLGRQRFFTRSLGFKTLLGNHRIFGLLNLESEKISPLRTEFCFPLQMIGMGP